MATATHPLSGRGGNTVSSVVRGTRGPAGQEWARTALFGVDPPGVQSADEYRSQLVDAMEQLVEQLQTCTARLRLATDEASDLGHLLKAAADGLDGHVATAVTTLSRLRAMDTGRPLRVALMGRTMAGKSTLFEFLSRGDGSRVGDGRQRVTREACARTSEALGFEVVDTPGVGALDGAEDYNAAFREVPEADLILWVATDQAAQEQTGRALRHLGALGKPIVVALNCLANLDDPIGFDDLTTTPEVVYGGDSLANLGPIDRYLASVGASRSRAVQFHAAAALRSMLGDDDAITKDTLRANSRIDDLLAVLAEEGEKEPLRRALSMCDQVRLAVLDLAAFLNEARSQVGNLAAATRGAQKTFVVQAERRVKDARQELETAVGTAVNIRERWFEEFQIDGDVSTQWAEEAKRIEVDVATAAESVSERLRADLQDMRVDTADDWAAFSPGELDDLTGFGQSWANRALKLGSRVGLAVGSMEAGAAIGALFGGVGAIPGGVIGGVLGLIAGFTPLQHWIDGAIDLLFRSRVEVQRRRRVEVREKLRPVLMDIREALDKNVNDLVEGWLTTLREQAAEQDAAVDRFELSGGELDRSIVRLRATLETLDLAVARRLLGLVGRTRAAAAVRRATRWQGVGIAIDLPEPLFTEHVLFPIPQTDEPLVAVAEHPTFPATSSLELVTGLFSGAATIRHIAERELELEMTMPTPDGVRASWSDLAFAHTGIRPKIV